MIDEHKLYLRIGQQLPKAEESQLFGKPCFKINKKAFFCFFQEKMVFKLFGEAHPEALSNDGSKLFDPSGKGRPMKEWVQVSGNYSSSWETLAKSAFEYVLLNQKNS
ncbi:hypothetical protein OAD66_01930 [Bacteroidia bacterium]|nr:hypothetical protein [Bacteroidia bacterium]MDB9881871.1 hypothetical protein [Bacteroidia bacterium]